MGNPFSLISKQIAPSISCYNQSNFIQMKKLLLAGLSMMAIVLFGLESKAIDITITDTGTGTGTTTWTSNNVYILDGFVFVNSGQTLTIEAGTVIKGMAGQGEDASALIVAQGGTILANGTAAEPIIMTYEADPLDGSTPPYIRGQWGGLIVLGEAQLNSAPGTSNIEGIPTTEPRGEYGGTDDADNSGVIRYVSVRHGGTDIGAGNEINGITLGGVGSGTVIEHVEVYANADDGIEFFGGTAEVKWATVAFCGDDSFDYDEGWRGKGQFWFTVQDAVNGEGDRGGEHDGGTSPEDGTPYTTPVIYNATTFGRGIAAGKRAMTLRDNAGGEYHNSIFVNWGKGIDIENLASGEDSYARFVAGDLGMFDNCFFNCVVAGTGATASDLFKISMGSGWPTALDSTNALSASTAAWQASFANNGNGVADPGVDYDITDGSINPVPTSAGTGTAPTDSFYDPVTYKGAFDPAAANWAWGWTALDEYGFLENFTLGCTDATACNYDASADTDDGSCTYATDWYADSDNDGYGDAGSVLNQCDQPMGYVANDEDCDDTDENVNPDATEIPDNGIDDDCNLSTPDVILPCEIFWSEYSEGSSNNKYMEIYNPTTVAIDLTQYAYPNVSNGNSNPGTFEFWNEFEAGASVAPGDVYVIAHPSADAAILAEADETFTFLSNGNDYFALVFGTETDFTIIDKIGEDNDGTSPSDFDVAGVSGAAKDNTLVRKSYVSNGNTDWPSSAGTNATDSEWIVAGFEIWTGLGAHDYTGQCSSTPGCTDETACNYDDTATVDDGSCTFPGCNDETACNYDENAGCDDGSCDFVSCAGCTDASACNYDDTATIDDGTCDYSCQGCTDPNADNYDSTVTEDNGSCVYSVTFQVDMSDYVGSFTTVYVSGSFNSFSGTANPLSDADMDDVWTATIALPAGDIEFRYSLDNLLNVELFDGSETCTVNTSGNWNRAETVAFPTTLDVVCYDSCDACEIIFGCTYPGADNYDNNAEEDDGSCTFTVVTGDSFCGDGTSWNPATMLCEGDGSSDCPEDLNGDELVNTTDLLQFLGAFGTSCN